MTEPDNLTAAAGHTIAPAATGEVGEPVAWRARHSKQENWYLYTGPVGWWECQPLYAASTVEALAAENARLSARVAELKKGLEPLEDGKVYVEVYGLTGTGKSAVMGEIEIALMALGVPVEHDAEFVSEKRMTHADWQDALEFYNPVVVLRERNVSRAASLLRKGGSDNA